MKKIISIVLSVMLICGTFAFPALAAGSSDADEAVTILMDLGIAAGYPDGQYHPERSISRSEFCKLAIIAEGHESKVSSSATRMLFTDVASSHWALGYINLAYDEGLVAGNGDGTFAPDRTVTLAEAVTVCLRLLGYSESEIGPFWPDDYLIKARDIGLCDGISADGSSAIDRGEAATLIKNMLYSDNTNGHVMYESLGSSSIEEAIILSNNADATDGTKDTLMVYTNGSIRYFEQSREVSDTFIGRSGCLLLDKSGKTCGFLPDDGYSVTITVASVSASAVTDTEGNKFEISSDTYIWENDERDLYGSMWYDLENRELTFYYTENGTLALITVSEPVAYSGIMLSGYYEDVSPNTDDPAEITLLGHTFAVADDAENAGKFEIGDRITVELNGTGEIVNVWSQDEKKATVIALLIDAKRGEFEHLSGLTLTAEIANSSSASKYEGSLVRLNASGRGECYIYGLDSGEYRSLNVTAKKLGSTPLASNVKIFDKANGSNALEISLEDLLVDSVEAEDILYASTNESGEVDLIILDDVTGDCYTYGIFHTKSETERSSAGLTIDYLTVAVENSDGIGAYYRTGLDIKDGQIGGATNTEHWNSSTINTLTEVDAVPRNAFNGVETLVIDGVSVPIAENVQVYNSHTEKWITLSTAKGYAESFTVYYSGTLGADAKVRVVVV